MVVVGRLGSPHLTRATGVQPYGPAVGTRGRTGRPGGPVVGSVMDSAVAPKLSAVQGNAPCRILLRLQP